MRLLVLGSSFSLRIKLFTTSTRLATVAEPQRLSSSYIQGGTISVADGVCGRGRVLMASRGQDGGPRGVAGMAPRGTLGRQAVLDATTGCLGNLTSGRRN